MSFCFFFPIEVGRYSGHCSECQVYGKSAHNLWSVTGRTKLCFALYNVGTNCIHVGTSIIRNKTKQEATPQILIVTAQYSSCPASMGLCKAIRVPQG